jgi:hypothetical protein
VDEMLAVDIYRTSIFGLNFLTQRLRVVYITCSSGFGLLQTATKAVTLGITRFFGILLCCSRDKGAIL